MRGRLAALAPSLSDEYCDAYVDTAAGDLDADGREFRIRTIVGGEYLEHLLTFKSPPVNEASGSQPEHEVHIADHDAAGGRVGRDGIPVGARVYEAVRELPVRRRTRTGSFWRRW